MADSRKRNFSRGHHRRPLAGKGLAGRPAAANDRFVRAVYRRFVAGLTFKEAWPQRCGPVGWSRQ